MSLNDKAADNYHLAKMAYDSGWYDAAASRMYYAFYQACVEGIGKPLDQYDAKLAKEIQEQGRENHFPHKTVCNRCTRDLHLNERQQDIIKQARQMRVMGDYYPKQRVTKDDLEGIFSQSETILKDLGVAI